ncbi:hypothetical protein [Polaribacter sp. Hel1_85]|uniref:hypothetical protein n=1 Tax=Polaribacter sp. Hel1_85 TaxID=1250005 RepID=UPI00052D587E|nr:hypothetical protein [Polaribacter sp. Hel1_85]KGL58707.1 hypothetical protein PHEL85_2973 [Polaribacter sp. Hel1_85]
MKIFNTKITILLKGIFFSTVLLLTSSCMEEGITSLPEEEIASSLKEEITNTYASRTVNTSTLAVHDFDNNSLGSTFAEDQGYTGSAIYGEGMSFQNGYFGGKRLKLTWKESEYDGTRRERGHEIKLNVHDNSAIYTGFHLFIPSGQSNNLLNKNTIIWQLYNWNTDGCSNWTAHLSLKNDDLYLSYRSACVTATEVLVKSNIATNTNLAFKIRAVLSGTNHGTITVMIDDVVELNKKSINLGFGNFDSNDDAETSVVGIKMGMYCYDTSNYTDDEVRILYLDNVGSCVRTGSITNSYNLIDPNNY